MLMLAGLAYYQGHEDPLTGEHGSLIGTAVTKQPEHPDIDGDTPAGLDEQDREYCESNKPPGESH